MEEKIVRLETVAAPETSMRDKWKARHGLLWCEWYAHSKVLLFFLAAWLACVWVLPLYANPAWILLFGGLYAVVAGPIYGGSGTVESCGGVTFPLPPPPGRRYLAPPVVGGGALFLFY